MKPTIIIKELKEKSIAHNFSITATYDCQEGYFIVGYGKTMEEATADLLESFQFSPEILEAINKIESPKPEMELPTEF